MLTPYGKRVMAYILVGLIAYACFGGIGLAAVLLWVLVRKAQSKKESN